MSMANSVTLISDSFENRYMQLVCTQRKDNEKSYIDWTLSSVGGNVNYYATGPTTVTINGTQVYYKARVAWQDKVFPASKGSEHGTIEVEHDANGNKTITVSMSTIIYYGASKVATYSDSWELDPIPRGATLTSVPSTFTNASLPTIHYTNPLGNQVSKLEVCIADSVGWYALAPYRDLSKTGSSYTFTDDDMKALNANFESKDKTLGVMFVIRTTTADGKVYSDGEPSTYEMVATDDTKPSVSISSCKVYNPAYFPSALANTYVQGKSCVDLDVIADGKYGATISHFTLSVDGQNQMSFGMSEKEHDSTWFLSDAITSKGTVVVTVGATDSRGFPGKAENSITVSEYTKPWVVPLGNETAIQCYRSDGNGKRVGSSTSVWVKVKRSYHSLGGKNLCKLQWRRKTSTGDWSDDWVDLIARTNTTTDEYNALISGTVFELTKSYSLQIRAVDDIGEEDVKTLEVPTQDVALHLGKGGKNVSIGEYCDYSEPYTFRSAWKATFENGIYGTLNGTVNGTTSPQYASDVYSFAVGCPPGLTPFITGAGTTSLPSASNYEYATGFVSKRSNEIMTVVLFNYYASAIAINTYYSALGGWQGWKYIHPTTT
jgi:hypothetical protein